MACPVHPTFRGPASRCVQCNAFEAKLLMLGPRTPSEYASLQRAHNIPVDAPMMAFVSVDGGVVQHVVYAVAKEIRRKKLGPAHVSTFFANQPEYAAWAYRNAAGSLSQYIQAVGNSCIKAATPLGMHDTESIESFVRAQGIKGVRIDMIAAEYDAAFGDMVQLLAKKRLLSTETHVWHASVLI